MERDDVRLYHDCTADFHALLRSNPTGGFPRSADDICNLVERQRGIAIHRYPASLGGHPLGLLLRARGFCLILYERCTTPWHQQGIILHECGHIFYDHQGTEAGTAAALQVLVPDLVAGPADNILQRLGGWEGQRPEDERQAEAFATTGLVWFSRTEPLARDSRPSPLPLVVPDDPAVANVVRRLLADFAGWPADGLD